MAAALLMMNMHGAVMASDCDRTIFRYSEKIPFAVMADPRSELHWEDIMMAYQSRKSITSENSFKEYVENFYLYMADVLNQEKEAIRNKEQDNKVICVGYDPNDLFPHYAILTINKADSKISLFKIINKINERNSEFHIHLGNCANIQILFGGMSEDILETVKTYFGNKLGEIMGNKDAATDVIKKFNTVYSNAFNKIQNDPQVRSAISDFTVKDMVAMAENLIETEGLQSDDNPTITPVREIGVLTLAEGFVWIKHCLYGV